MTTENKTRLSDFIIAILKYFTVPLILPIIHHLLFFTAWFIGNYLFLPFVSSVFIMLIGFFLDMPVIFLMTLFKPLLPEFSKLYIGEDFFITAGFLIFSFFYWFCIGLLLKIKFFIKPIKHFIVIFIVLDFVSFIGTGICEIDGARENLCRISCASKLEQIGLALHQYSMDNDDDFPDKDDAKGLEMLRKNDYLTDYNFYTCPSVNRESIFEAIAHLVYHGTSADRKPEYGNLTEENVSFCYNGKQKYSPDNKTPVAWDKRYNHKKDANTIDYVIDGGNVLLANGEIETVKGRNWEVEFNHLEMLKKNKK